MKSSAFDTVQIFETVTISFEQAMVNYSRREILRKERLSLNTMFKQINSLLLCVCLAVLSLAVAKEFESRECTVNGESLTMLNATITTMWNVIHRCMFDKPEEVLNVTIKNSTIKNFTDEMCGTFVNIKILKVINTRIDQIDEGAFYKCVNLTAIIFDKSDFPLLSYDFFRSNKELRVVIFNKIRLKTSLLNTFSDLKNLEVLMLVTDAFNDYELLPDELLLGKINGTTNVPGESSSSGITLGLSITIAVLLIIVVVITILCCKVLKSLDPIFNR